jgi:hypothetical protein
VVFAQHTDTASGQIISLFGDGVCRAILPITIINNEEIKINTNAFIVTDDTMK